MSYICAQCRVPWPCKDARHNVEWSAKQWYPDDHGQSIACFLFDHEECLMPLTCACKCHKPSILEEPSISVPPSNR